MAKPAKLVSEKNLSGLGGVYDVTFGDATPARREQGDFSKQGIPAHNPDAFDDYTEKRERWEKEYGTL